MSEKNDPDFKLPEDFVAGFKIPEGVVEKATAKVEEAQQQMLKEMAQGFVEAMGGIEATVDFAKQIEELLKQQLPPDLLEKHIALNSAMEARAAKGENPFSDENVVKLFTELNADPRYVAITEQVMFGEDETADSQPDVPGENAKRALGGTQPG